MRRTTTPVKRRPGDGGEPDWRHEETVTVRRVRRVAASEAQQHVGSGASAGPGIKTGVSDGNLVHAAMANLAQCAPPSPVCS